MTLSECRKKLQERERQLAFITKVTGVLTGFQRPLELKLQASLGLILEQVRARAGSIMLLENGGSTLKIVAATRKQLVGRTQHLSEDSVSAHVCRTRSPLLIRDIAKDARFRLRQGYTTNSLLSVPLHSVEEGHMLGVINASDHQESSPFTADDLDTVIRYATWISPLLESSILLTKLKGEKDRYRATAEELSLKQQEIMISSTERSELVEMVVHDFKSPLTAIISNLDLLRYVGLLEEQRPIVEIALGGAKRLLEMINDFLEITRLDHLCTETRRFQPVAVRPVLELLLQELTPVSNGKRIRMGIANSDDISVLAEPTLLHHLFQNLLSNALKYTPEGGRIHVGWKRSPSSSPGDGVREEVRFTVEDSGIGIPNEIKDKIFQKFTRGNRKEDIRLDGSGLGLFVCRKIVTLLRGAIWVEDAQPQGSRFCFTLLTPPGNEEHRSSRE
jgi:signal transduction histidine kinase